MPSQIVVENGRKIQRVAGGQDLDLGPADAQPSATESGARTAAKYLLNPEVYSTAAAMMAPETGGASLLIPAAIGGGVSIARDLSQGERDPMTIGGDALLHAGVGAIPGIGGTIARRISLARSGAQVASPMLDAASDLLPGKAGLAAKIGKILGIGATDAAPALAPAAANPLADMTLAGGTKVLSSDGLKALVQKSVELENTPGAASPATRKALDDLIAQVRSHIHPDNVGAPGLLESVGLPSGSAMAAKAAAAKAAAETSAGNLLWKVRLALGLGDTTASATHDAANGGN